MEIPKELPANAGETQTRASRAIAIMGCVLVTVTVILRYLGRWCLKQRMDAGTGKAERVYGMDDAFNVAAVVTFFVLVYTVLMAIDRGMGLHIQVVLFEGGAQGLSDFSYAVFLSAIFYNTTLGMIKLSVLSLYQRILRGVQSQILPTIVWVLFGVIVFNTTANVLLATFQCWPIKAAWDVTSLPQDKHCIDINAFYIGNAITGVITDTLVYLISVPIVMPLQMDTKTKLQLLGTMLIGGFAVITSIIRLSFVPALISDPDVTMAIATPMNWSIVEPAVGILVSSMPTIRAIRYLWRKPENESCRSGAGHSALKSGNSGHIQLYNLNNNKKGTASDAESRRTRDADDNGSEEGLVGRNPDLKPLGQISKITELEVSYSSK